MIASIFAELTTSGGLYVGFLGDLIETVLGLFWVPTDGSVAGHLTTFGQFTVLGIVIGLVWGIVGLIRRLVKLRG